MSAIGNYIHWTAEGYKQYGTAESKNASSMSVEQAIAAQKLLLKNRINNYEKIDNRKLKPLENKINKLLETLGEEHGNPNSKQWENQAKTFIKGLLDEEFENLQEINWENLSINTPNKGVGKIKERYSKYKNWRKEITSRVEQLNIALQKMEAGIGAKEGVPQEEYSLAIDKLNILLNDTYQKTWEAISQTGIRVNPKAVKNLIKELNNLIGQYAAMPNIYKQSGSLFERVIQLVPQMGKDLTKESIIKAIKETEKGQDMVSVRIDEESFSKRALGKKNLETKNWERYQFGDVTQEIHSSQNKIDVSFNWKDTLLNISAKNVDLGKEGYRFIHTLSGSSLDYLLQDENPDFVNHYLNLYSRHYRKRGVTYNWNTQKEEIYKVLKLTIAYKGLTGDTYGRNNFKTNVFIVHNKSSKKNSVKVISIEKVLKNMFDNSFGNISVSDNVHNMYLNKKVEGYPHIAKWQRVANVLQEMHNRKVETSINSSLVGKW